MSSSPFPANATLTFQVPIGATTIDELGNPIANTRSLTVQAYLKVDNIKPKSQPMDGGEIAQIYLTGRCVEPSFLPAGLLPGAKATAIVRDLGGIMPDLNGDFFLEASIGSAFGTTAILGGAIKGVLAISVIWGSAA